MNANMLKNNPSTYPINRSLYFLRRYRRDAKFGKKLSIHHVIYIECACSMKAK